MKTNKGFVPIAIVLIGIAILAVGGVAYYAGIKNNSVPKNTEVNDYQSQQNETNNVPVMQNNQQKNYTATNSNVSLNSKLSDDVIAMSIDPNYSLSNNFTYKSKDGYNYSISKIYRGDFNNDGYEDAIVLSSACSASCGSGISFVENNKNGAGKLITNLNFPFYFQFAGSGKTYIKNIEVNNGIISITADNFCGREPVQENGFTCNYLSPRTLNFQLQGVNLVKVK